MPSTKEIVDLFASCVEDALAGHIDDSKRAEMYRLALGMAVGEILRIEEIQPGTATLSTLMLLQQIAVVLDPETSPERLVGSMTTLVEKRREKEDRRPRLVTSR